MLLSSLSPSNTDVLGYTYTPKISFDSKILYKLNDDQLFFWYPPTNSQLPDFRISTPACYLLYVPSLQSTTYCVYSLRTVVQYFYSINI